MTYGKIHLMHDDISEGKMPFGRATARTLLTGRSHQEGYTDSDSKVISERE